MMNPPDVTIRQLYDAFAQADIAAVLAALDPAVEWTEAEGGPYGGTFIGPQAVLDNVFAKLDSEWQGFTAAPAEFISQEQTVVVLGEYSGTYKRTRKPFKAPFAHVWRLQEGKVIGFRQYTDTHLHLLPMQSNLRLRERF
ncbi:nuclear transport factor 2 family protein [Pseudomarimonas arenosa]|uniref:Nuclear transport factor 2 family protein n=1 Tax=Pseudomarimonas arenosa TaxID=2774145 RepID=A0AAW3ZF61_9GAMM|nr:nuclear transport factor 2 family protein [Pseudomarimonas arenosa]MBD8524284.1 nuclear transport factor 2 family protein [Pseudomarimonas arenosa]